MWQWHFEDAQRGAVRIPWTLQFQPLTFYTALSGLRARRQYFAASSWQRVLLKELDEKVAELQFSIFRGVRRYSVQVASPRSIELDGRDEAQLTSCGVPG